MVLKCFSSSLVSSFSLSHSPRIINQHHQTLLLNKQPSKATIPQLQKTLSPWILIPSRASRSHRLPYQLSPYIPPPPPQSPSRHHSLPSSPVITPISGARRHIAIAVDLSDESAFAVRWAVQNYLRPGDAVILLHIRPTSVLYGADWGAVEGGTAATSEESQQKLEDDFDNFTSGKASDLAQPLADAQIPFKIHIVKDHDMKERLCLEVERLGLSAVIMGSRGFGARRRSSKIGRLGSVSDYCVQHCVCPVVVVRYPEEEDECFDSPYSSTEDIVTKNKKVVVATGETELQPVPEEEQEYLDADEEEKGW